MALSTTRRLVAAAAAGIALAAAGHVTAHADSCGDAGTGSVSCTGSDGTNYTFDQSGNWPGFGTWYGDNGSQGWYTPDSAGTDFTPTTISGPSLYDPGAAGDAMPDYANGGSVSGGVIYDPGAAGDAMPDYSSAGSSGGGVIYDPGAASDSMPASSSSDVIYDPGTE